MSPSLQDGLKGLPVKILILKEFAAAKRELSTRVASADAKLEFDNIEDA